MINLKARLIVDHIFSQTCTYAHSISLIWAKDQKTLITDYIEAASAFDTVLRVAIDWTKPHAEKPQHLGKR